MTFYRDGPAAFNRDLRFSRYPAAKAALEFLSDSACVVIGPTLIEKARAQSQRNGPVSLGAVQVFLP